MLLLSTSLILPVPVAAALPPTAGLLHEKVTPVEGVATGVYEKVDPLQIGVRLTELVKTGTALTVTVTWLVLAHPFTSVPVTVKVVVVAGVASTLAVLDADKSAEGLHR